MSVTLATWKVEFRRIVVPVQPRQTERPCLKQLVGLVACAYHPSKSRKCKIEGFQHRMIWAESEILTPKPEQNGERLKW
jgi:hypothetical protein